MTSRRVDPNRPNFVFVFADDWGWGDLGCYGHPHVQTPNLDALASRGVLFTQFYVCSGVCSPSRAAALTGQFPARFGIHGHFADHERNAQRGMPNWLDPSVPTYTRLLGAHGYAVGHYGKWHLGHGEGAPDPFAYGIDECRVNVGNGPQLGFRMVYRSESDRGSRAKSSQVIVDEAIGFIERHRAEPFLLNVWLNDTHATLDPDEKQLEPYLRFMPAGLKGKHAGANAIYYAVVTDADRQVGRLLRRLHELGLDDNSIVIFSADNGPEDIAIRNASHSGVGSPGPFRGRKRSLYEGGIRVPFIVSWPGGGTPQGVVDDQTPLCAVDLLPTFCALAGVELGDLELDGEDMSAVIRGQPGPRTTPLMWEWRFRVHGHCLNKSPILAIRDGQWKLLLNPDRGRVELYDVPADPMELTNLAERYPGIVARLSDRVLGWQATLPDGPFDADAGSNAYPWPGRRLDV
jgi:N-acetylgalactosamine-6-sulfatase